MFIYSGNLGNCQYGPNETITVVFPARFELLDPVTAYWQWSNDPKLNKKASVANCGHIHSLTKTSDGYCLIHFSFGPCSFEGTVSPDLKTLSLTMDYPAGSPIGEPFSLTAMHTNHANVRSAMVYTGNLDWVPYARGEMMTIVVPYGVTKDAFFGLYYRWNQDPTRSRANVNAAVNGVFQNVNVESSGRITATYKDPNYTYSFTFGDRKGSLVLSNIRRGDVSDDAHFVVAYAG
ncbi:hypothetical protein GSI_01374 [Ganoderma sinense ZZ0214-1]|uniref:Uncharacterized protein n=1 Tax=Ganoderma sinense ZZ0214-1 TaxID=1077348 RepID=A0A2G8SV95_9APHY|nr:hypothetical protein GSI_01374 [Ganoderma sinense ZZ0214-1]